MGSLNAFPETGSHVILLKMKFHREQWRIMKEIKGILESIKDSVTALFQVNTERREKRKGKEKSYLQRHPPYLGQSARAPAPRQCCSSNVCDMLGVIPSWSWYESGLMQKWGKSLIQSLHFIWQTHAFKHVVLGKSLAPFPHRGSLSHLATRDPSCYLCL